MRTVYVKAPGEFQFREEPMPAPQNGQLLVDVAYCGICGSDVTLARKEARDWTALGHEVSGVVREVGPGVTHVRPGEKVALDCGNNCGICPECRAGRPRRCTALLGFYGTRSGYGDVLLADVQNVHPIGDLALRTACLLEPFGVAMNLFTCLDIDFLDDVLLIGPGPIGLLALATCRARGARSLTAWGRSPGARLDYARQLGAEVALVPDDCAERFDKVILTAPPELLPLAVRACRTNGVIAYCGLGAAGEPIVALDWDQIHGNNITIRPMGASPALLPQCLELLRRGIVDPDVFISHTFPRDQIPQAFAFLSSHRDEVVKVAIQVSDKR